MAWLRGCIANVVAVAAAALFGVADGQSGSFSGSCFAETHEFVNPYLGMYCRNRNVWEYGYNWTWYVFLLVCSVVEPDRPRINLDLCIANQNGQLAGWEK